MTTSLNAHRQGTDRALTYSQVRILILGLSTRAIAESAVRGGYNVITLDYFGDRDQVEHVMGLVRW